MPQCTIQPVEDLAARTTELADLMDEFRLDEAKLEGDGWKVSLRRKRRVANAGTMIVAGGSAEVAEEADVMPMEAAAPAAPVGLPVNSPMNGIYYSAPSPASPPFVKEGDTVTADQVVGLIEAMKVFNEIVAPISGTVVKMVAANGDLVNPGDPLLYIG